jgi:Adenylylsulfate kinase and related kinases
MGLPGSGKTTLASKLVSILKAKWINADKIRKESKDWDFSDEGRKRQAKRMSDFADKYKKDGHYVVADFICPTPQTRKLFNPDFMIWVDTIKKSRFKDTNKIFVKPKRYDVKVTEKDSEIWAIKIADQIKPYKWDNKKPTIQMLGRWQPLA